MDVDHEEWTPSRDDLAAAIAAAVGRYAFGPLFPGGRSVELSADPVTPVHADHMTILPVTSIRCLQEQVGELLSELSRPRSGVGIILFPKDFPVLWLEDLIQPLVSYGVSVENATMRDVAEEARRMAKESDEDVAEIEAWWSKSA